MDRPCRGTISIYRKVRSSRRGSQASRSSGFGLSLAAQAAQAAVASCRVDGYTVAVAITDADGNLKAALAPEGTRANGVYMAMHKALTVVGFKMSTLELRMKIESDPSLLGLVKPNMSLLPGGLPIYSGKSFIGAIATSGASAHAIRRGQLRDGGGKQNPVPALPGNPAAGLPGKAGDWRRAGLTPADKGLDNAHVPAAAWA